MECIEKIRKFFSQDQKIRILKEIFKLLQNLKQIFSKKNGIFIIMKKRFYFFSKSKLTTRNLKFL